VSKIALAPNASGTGTFTIAAPNSNTDRTLTLPDEAGTILTSSSDVLTSASSVTNIGGPAFSAYRTGSQSLGGASYNKILFNTEEFDTDSCFDTSTSKFTPNVAGYYCVIVVAAIDSSSTAPWILIRKNDVSHVKTNMGSFVSGTLNGAGAVTAVIYLNGSTDFVEGYAYVPSAVNLSTSSNASYFQAHFVRKA
jgi:hypothetical protein